jgi:hypothetical protein
MRVFPTANTPDLASAPWLDASAATLDGHLRRLARQEARGRRVLGRLARAFLRRRHHHDLGFARLRDYARERLGLSARELETLAHVVDGLERLPAIGGAFDAGQITWTQARCLIGLATRETQATWLAMARHRTARALEAAVARKSGRRVAGDDTLDDEPRLRVRLPCPRHVRARWGEVLELACCMCGGEVAPWQAAETVAAEGLSARGVEPDDPLADWEPPPRALPENETRKCLDALDWSVVDEALPADIESLARGADDVNGFALDRRMRAALRAMQAVDFQLGRLLRVFFERRLHQLLEFSTAARYVEERLGMSARKARALVQLDRRSAEIPALAVAYREGEVSWLRALSLLPVLSDGSAAAWVARAQAVTLRRLVDEVDWTLAMPDAGQSTDGPPAVGASRPARAASACARGRHSHHVLRAGNRRHPVPAGCRELHRARRARLARARAPPRPRPPGMEQPAAPPRPDLRAGRLAVRGPGVHVTPEPARPSSALSLARRRQRARQPDHDLRVAPPPRHPSGARAGPRCRAGRDQLGAGRPAGRDGAADPAGRLLRRLVDCNG